MEPTIGPGEDPILVHIFTPDPGIFVPRTLSDAIVPSFSLVVNYHMTVAVGLTEGSCSTERVKPVQFPQEVNVIFRHHCEGVAFRDEVT